MFPARTRFFGSSGVTGINRHKIRVRDWTVWSLHGSREWPTDEIMPDAN